jgi:predicted nuclease with TOPRIM domain
MQWELDECRRENERLQAMYANRDADNDEANAEVKRLQARAENLHGLYNKLEQQVERLQAKFERTRDALQQEVELRAEKERRITRLRKAVNWLRGAYHDALNDDVPLHHGSVDDCDVWECQRARAVLEEET